MSIKAGGKDSCVVEDEKVVSAEQIGKVAKILVIIKRVSRLGSAVS